MGWPTSPSRSSRRGSRTATPVATRTIRSPTGSWSGSPPTRTSTWSSTGTSCRPRSTLEPSATVRAIVDEVLAFQMPGAGIPGFLRKAAQIAKAGIYDLRVHRDEVLMPVIRHWRIFELTGLDAAAEDARRKLAEHLEQARRSGSPVRGASGRLDRSPDAAGQVRYRRWRRPATRRSRSSKRVSEPSAGWPTG